MKFPKTGTLAKLIIPAILIYALFMMADAREKSLEGKELLRGLRQQAETIRRENEILQLEIDSSGNDEVIASVARERFGLVMPDEKVFYDPSE